MFPWSLGTWMFFNPFFFCPFLLLMPLSCQCRKQTSKVKLNCDLTYKCTCRHSTLPVKGDQWVCPCVHLSMRTLTQPQPYSGNVFRDRPNSDEYSACSYLWEEKLPKSCPGIRFPWAHRCGTHGWQGKQEIGLSVSGWIRQDPLKIALGKQITTPLAQDFV